MTETKTPQHLIPALNKFARSKGFEDWEDAKKVYGIIEALLVDGDLESLAQMVWEDAEKNTMTKTSFWYGIENTLYRKIYNLRWLFKKKNHLSGGEDEKV